MATQSLRSLLAIGLVGLALGACSPTVATRGNIADAERLGEIRPGTSTRDDVAVILGSPSTVGTFDQDTWYYIGQRTEKTAFFNPEIVERKVVVIHFDQTGVVEKVEELGLDDAQAVAYVDRETPTAGRELTFLEQMLGNLGRFNRPQ